MMNYEEKQKCLARYVKKLFATSAYAQEFKEMSEGVKDRLMYRLQSIAISCNFDTAQQMVSVYDQVLLMCIDMCEVAQND